MIKYNELPLRLQNPEVLEVYNILSQKKGHIFLKRVFDIVLSIILTLILIVPAIIIAIMIKFDSSGPVFFRQERVTRYGKVFRIHKFRTMKISQNKTNSLITGNHDNRVTRVGYYLRKYRLDEIPQIIDILSGDMSFVGARPEVPYFVEKYSNEMLSTLLLPAGLTSLASISYKDESELLTGESGEENEYIYVNQILPLKMNENIKYMYSFEFLLDCRILLQTIIEVFLKNE